MKNTITALILTALLPSSLLAGEAEDAFRKAGTQCLKDLLMAAKEVPADKADTAAKGLWEKIAQDGGFPLTEEEKKAITSGTLKVKDYAKTIEAYQEFKKPPYKRFEIFANHAESKDLTEPQKLFMAKLLEKLQDQKTAMWRTQTISKAKVAVVTLLQYKMDKGSEPEDIASLKLEDHAKFTSPASGKTLDWVLLPEDQRFSIEDRKVILIAPEPAAGHRIVAFTDGGVIATPETNIPAKAKPKP